MQDVSETIESVEPAYNYIFIGERRFRVSPTAAILDNSGRKSLPLRLLPLPCKAMVTYHLYGDHRDPLVVKIHLK